MCIDGVDGCIGEADGCVDGEDGRINGEDGCIGIVLVKGGVGVGSCRVKVEVVGCEYILGHPPVGGDFLFGGDWIFSIDIGLVVLTALEEPLPLREIGCLWSAIQELGIGL